MIDITEYIPSPAEQQNQKAFSIAPAKEDLTKKILQTRRYCFRHPDLQPGAKLLFCYLLDFSLLWEVNRRPGVLTISTTKLSDELHCSKRVIYKWKRQLVSAGFIWITPWLIPNAWPIDTYHITILDPPSDRNEETTAGDGMWGNGARRQKVEPGPGARRPGQLVMPLRGEGGVVNKTAPEKKADPANLPENSPASGTKRPLSVAQNAPANRIICDGERQNVPRGVAQFATGSGTKRHLPIAQNAPGSGTKRHSSKETQIRINQSLSPGRASAPPIKNFLDAKERLAAIQKRIRAIKAHPENYEKTLSREVTEAIAWLRDPANNKTAEDKAKHDAEIKRRLSNPRNYIKGAMTDQAKADLADLDARREEVETAMAGFES
ncbi:MAG TPA: hypothetical protein VG167_14940 [Verrucomicrobiae bacterium]|nr:hypothetical protein [Verrucomicrobiae bacterium]